MERGGKGLGEQQGLFAYTVTGCRKFFLSIYIYKAERVSVCLSVCMYVRYACLNRLSNHNETLDTCT